MNTTGAYYVALVKLAVFFVLHTRTRTRYRSVTH
jgi:hypothetical protein